MAIAAAHTAAIGMPHPLYILPLHETGDLFALCIGLKRGQMAIAALNPQCRRPFLHQRGLGLSLGARHKKERGRYLQHADNTISQP